MIYTHIEKGTFLDRPNRFIAHVDVCGRVETVHVKNTGRCRELLVPGATVYLDKPGTPNRKTEYDLVAVEKGTRLINMDAQAPNKVFDQWARKGNFIPELTFLRSEYTWGDSRFDFYAEAGERRMLIEVKGVTLERDGAVFFPDAPTLRGLKHINELISAREQGYETYLFFVVQMQNAEFFSPNDDTHPQFGQALRRAAGEGVNIIAYDCCVTPESLKIRQKVPVKL
jgi:sugar fermentation stimulation protein A